MTLPSILLGIPLLVLANSDDRAATPYSYHLGSVELETAKAEALFGSPVAARKVLDHYYMRGVPDMQATRYWALIGAENGDAESQYTAWVVLRVSDDPEIQRRSLFWLKRAASQDYPAAVADLEDCSTWPSMDRSDPEVPCFGPGAED